MFPLGGEGSKLGMGELGVVNVIQRIVSRWISGFGIMRGILGAGAGLRVGRMVLWVEGCFDVGLGSDLSAFPRSLGR